MKKTIPIAVLVLLAAVVSGLIYNQNSEANQPIAYSHYKHVEEAGMECLDCHKYAEENPRASIPNIETCRDCHDEAVSGGEEEAKLLNFVKENQKIPWRQIYAVPDYAYFSHQRHVKVGQIECSACHGEVQSFTTPISKPFKKVTMEWCIDCHRRSEVSNDCYACHR